MKDRKSYLVDITCVKEKDGTLLAVEGGAQIPFQIARMFCVKSVTPGSSRGDHATKKTKLILIPVAGSCDVVVDDGKNKITYHMDQENKGLYIDEMIWRSMQNFTPDCVMLALADRVFEPGNETYDDYEEYLTALKRGE